MAITDQTVLNEIQGHLVEPQDNGATWASGHWTVSEVIGHLNNIQYDFLKRTQILLKRGSLATLPEVFRHDLPVDLISIHRVVWKSADTPAVYTEVPRSDGWEADHTTLDWPYEFAQVPKGYTDGELPSLQIETFPAVNVAGQLQVLYSYLSTLLTGLGVNFTVPDEFVPCIKWGVMADMLGKVGRGHDPQRAEYCSQRYEEGIEAAEIMLSGWA